MRTNFIASKDKKSLIIIFTDNLYLCPNTNLTGPSLKCRLSKKLTKVLYLIKMFPTLSVWARLIFLFLRPMDFQCLISPGWTKASFQAENQIADGNSF